MTEVWAMATVVFATLLGATGSLLFKLGSERLTLNLRKLLTNYVLIAGVIVYGVSAIIFVFALTGGELSVLYPLVATSYIWTCLFSVKFLKEKMNWWKWLGILLIVIGVSFIGMGS